jgi:hypothetical protein
MFADIKRIVNEDISSRVNQYDVLFEAITNAIHANATEIVCVLDSSDNLLKSEDNVEVADKKVDSISIYDNGNGMTTENYNSFCNYRTEHKKALGCKGVGRFVFLKIYEKASYTSSLIAEQKIKKFDFDFDFDTDNIKTEPSEIQENLTEILLKKLTPQYLDASKGIDRRIEMNLEKIREKVLINLIPTLFFYKKKGISISITFINKTTQESLSIADTDIPNFKEHPFEVQDKEGKKYQFILNQSIENNVGKLHTFYCANNRTVCDFASTDFKLTLPYGFSGYLLLESNYFDTKVNHERNNFDIYPVRTDWVSPLSWELINTGLKRIIADIVKVGIPDTETINRVKLQEIQDERPYLINYIEADDIEMAGFLDKKNLIDSAKKRFDISKEKILNNAGKSSYTDDELNEAIEIAQNELVSYINDRAMVLERLRKLVDKKERVEKVIHNLFMERYSDSDYFSIGRNNLWLLDDRFTTYSYAASDKRIKDVLKQIGEDINDTEFLEDKPDLSIFFSHNPDNPKRLKSVIVEIKPFDYQTASDRKKFAGLQQLIDYATAFKAKENIEEVFAFLITDVDEKLSKRLTIDGYNPLFSLDEPVYHRFFDKIGLSIYVISATSLVKDAEARNKVFLDIIRKQDRLSKILGNKL